MSVGDFRYSLDSNVLIEAWNNYYAPEFCPDYWEILNDFGRQGLFFLAREAYEEITGTDDNLTEWLKKQPHPCQGYHWFRYRMPE